MKGIVDRIESRIVVVEVEGEMLELVQPENLSVREGDVVILSDDRMSILSVDLGKTASRKREIESLFERLKR